MANRLAAETSPYLQQHADNPVDWYPWGEEALTLARELDKPILLSIGYSACHWCHVMAHESFEDPEVAGVMNQHFINIKVDREERPDLDHIYQTAHAMLTQRNGGWPLTLFLTPGQVPYFAGTYFPKTARYNLPGFKELLPRVADFYYTGRDDLEQQNTSLLQAFERTLPVSSETNEFSPAPLNSALNDLKQSFDQVFGGFSQAPKFPRPTELEFCLQHAAEGGDPASKKMALFTLAKMANGGIFDQLGGGFCRYSVDERWAIPHFEKMLYDNGPLLSLYTDAYLVSEDANFKRIVEETASWVMREMQSPQGGYFSALDADSEHEEGKFYVWTTEEVSQLLSPEELVVVQMHYGLNQPPNFENHYWHLIIAAEFDEVATTLGIPLEQARRLLTAAKAKLWSARESRIHPGRDEKVLVSWNGLMIKGMARAGRTFGREEWIASAQRAIDFIRSTLWKEGRLLATFKDGKANLNAYLDDYAFLLDALLEMMQAHFRPEDLSFAKSLADVLLQQFEDNANGGFFFTSHDHEKLIHRPKPGHDNAIPSGNGVAAYALQRLGHLLGESAYIEAGERTLKLYYPAMETQPAGYMSLLLVLREYLSPTEIIILRGPANELAGWQATLAKVYRPNSILLYLNNDMKDLPESLNKPVSDHVNAWVCQGVKCLPAINRLEELIQVFKSVSVS